MKLENLTMPPFNTSLMGVVKGVLDYYGIKMSDAMAFGGSGHAFLINMHDQLCPSGPYCWSYEPFYALLRNLGLEMTDLGFFHAGSAPAERGAVEAKLKEALDRGLPCSHCNMENQLITGYDEKRFFLAQPWTACVEVTPPVLTFGSWAEFGKEVHVNFFVFRKLPQKDEGTVVRESIDHARNLFRNPEKYTSEKYGIGPKAYVNWEKGITQGLGASHGNWWNATVWSECRAMASGYFAEIGERFPHVGAPALELSRSYKEIAELMAKASNKEMGATEKLGIVRELSTREESAVRKVEEFIRLFTKATAPGAGSQGL